MSDKTYTETELNEIAEARAEARAMGENMLTFMNISLQRSQMASDRPAVYNAGVAIFNKLVAPPKEPAPQPAPKEDEPKKDE